MWKSNRVGILDEAHLEWGAVRDRRDSKFKQVFASGEIVSPRCHYSIALDWTMYDATKC